MIGINKAAAAVTEALSQYGAEFSLLPDFRLTNLAERRIVVVPISEDVKMVSRTQKEIVYKIDVGITQKADIETAEALISFTETLGNKMLAGSFLGAVCVSVMYDPVISTDDLRQKGQYIGVISLGLKEIC